MRISKPGMFFLAFYDAEHVMYLRDEDLVKLKGDISPILSTGRRSKRMGVEVGKPASHDDPADRYLPSNC
jgi:hypothetical protein